MLLTKPIFPHPYQSDDPIECEVCDLCGAPADKAIHDIRFAHRWADGFCWWPLGNDGDAP